MSLFLPENTSLENQATFQQITTSKTSNTISLSVDGIWTELGMNEPIVINQSGKKYVIPAYLMSHISHTEGVEKNHDAGNYTIAQVMSLEASSINYQDDTLNFLMDGVWTSFPLGTKVQYYDDRGELNEVYLEDFRYNEQYPIFIDENSQGTVIHIIGVPRKPLEKSSKQRSSSRQITAYEGSEAEGVVDVIRLRAGRWVKEPYLPKEEQDRCEEDATTLYDTPPKSRSLGALSSLKQRIRPLTQENSVMVQTVSGSDREYRIGELNGRNRTSPKRMYALELDFNTQDPYINFYIEGTEGKTIFELEEGKSWVVLGEIYVHTERALLNGGVTEEQILDRIDDSILDSVKGYEITGYWFKQVHYAGLFRGFYSVQLFGLADK